LRHLGDKYTRRDPDAVSNSTQESVELPDGPLRPMPEHLYDAVLDVLRQSLGGRWGVSLRAVHAVVHSVRSTVDELDGVYVAADFDHDANRGVRVQLWVDRDDFDLALADDIVNELLRGLGDREILVMCRTFEDDGIHYRFASGTVEAALIGTIVLVGPYARDAARLARIGSGQPLGFSA
jgi:hypothetical protein